MLELSEEQLLQLEEIRQDEIIERLLLELRTENPTWLEQKGLWPAMQMLRDLREEARALGIRDPDVTERFMRHGLAYTDFHQQSVFIDFMKRPVDDSPEQRFQDYESIVEFNTLMRDWKAYEATQEAR